MQVIVVYTGLLQLEMRKSEETFELEPGASLGDLLELIRAKGVDFAGYFAVVEPPGQRASSVPLQQAKSTVLAPKSRVTFVYRFAGG